MAQPHIIDHTRLHLDVVAETPIVATCPARSEQATVGVQVGVDCDAADEFDYEGDVVSVRDAYSMAGYVARQVGLSLTSSLPF